jgi:hypothetical protein
MTLKELYTYQNILAGHMDQLFRYLENDSNVTVVTQEHHRSEQCNGAKDETVTVQPMYPKLPYGVDDLSALLVRIIKERECVGNMISMVKKRAAVDIDVQIATNRDRQRAHRLFASLSEKTDNVVATTSSMGKTFNAEGNQTSYVYDVTQTTKLDYDPEYLYDSAQVLKADAEAMSSAIDLAETLTCDFEKEEGMDLDFKHMLKKCVVVGVTKTRVGI